MSEERSQVSRDIEAMLVGAVDDSAVLEFLQASVSLRKLSDSYFIVGQLYDHDDLDMERVRQALAGVPQDAQGDEDEWEDEYCDELAAIAVAREMLAKSAVVQIVEDDFEAELALDQFLLQVAQAEEFAAGKLVTLRTKLTACQCIRAVSEKAEAAIWYGSEFKHVTADGVVLRLHRFFVPLGLHVDKCGACHNESFPAVNNYPCVVADYSACTQPHTETDEHQLIQSYLFELAASHDIVFSPSPIVAFAFEEPEWTSDFEDELKLRPLEGSNEAIGLYLAAAQVTDVQLRYFSFFKVLEYFVPVVHNLEAHEQIRKKLDSPKALSPDGTFIRELLVISKAFDRRKSERDLMTSVLLKALDLVELNALLPPSLQAKELSYESPDKVLDAFATDVAECLVSTRHSVAHAKANYDSHGTECPDSELPQLVRFVEIASQRVIRWYNRLPEHQRAEIGV